MLSRVLEGDGHTVVAARDGKVGISTFREGPVDLILTDMYMPEGDGFEVLIAVQQAQTKRPPVIAMSAATGDTDMLKAARLVGATVTLHKPFTDVELLRAVDGALKKPERKAAAAT